MRTTTRRAAVAVLGWAAAAVLATLIGIGGVRLIGDSLTSTPGGVLDQGDVQRALAAHPSSGPAPATPATSQPATSGPATSGPATSEPAGDQRAFSAAGGTVVAGCRGSGAYLVSWSPAPGYRVTQQESEPGDHVEVRFEGPDGRSDIRVACAGGHPVPVTHDSGHGG